MTKKIKMSSAELRSFSSIPQVHFKTHVSSLLNHVNRVAQATRPKQVGQMTELIEKFRQETTDYSLEAWEKWYMNAYPEGISRAVDKIIAKLREIEQAMQGIDKNTIRTWVHNLVIHKTYEGLMCQRAILQKIAEITRLPLRTATPEEEGKGIDGHIGGLPVSIKPDTYKQKEALSEDMSNVTMIYYKKDSKGLSFEFDAARFMD